jgi:hypothetical protein
MAESLHISSRLRMATEKSYQNPTEEALYYENAAGTYTTTSRGNQALLPFTILLSGFVTIGLCIAAIIWLWLEGPMLVPGQDTRITAIVISVGKSLAAFSIGLAIYRSAWASVLPRVLNGNPVPTRTLVGICRNWASFGQWQDYHSLPVSFKIYLVLATFVVVAMTGTSASFRYDSHGVSGLNTALIPDFSSSCNTSLIQLSYYFCTALLNGNSTDANTAYNINANTSKYSWNYIEQVNTGGQGTVSLYGDIGDEKLGANVTLAVLPSGWYMNEGSNLPWMAMSVSCTSLSIAAEFSGSGLLANATILVNGTVIDTLDIANMPQWTSVVHIYQRPNDTGPVSSLCPWIAVMLNGYPGEGQVDFVGLADDAATYLGNSYLDLHGYSQPYYQGVIGAAAYCVFDGSTGGQWPDELWPPRGDTSNFVIGPLVNNRPTMGTGVLNYGPSWQYTPVSGGSLPGGSISFIANNTGPGVSFPDLFASYIRNEWALMAYSMAPQSYYGISAEFDGFGSDKLFIGLTIIAVLPLSALVVGLIMTMWACIVTIKERRWVSRVEFESWWLVKALRPDIYSAGYGNAIEKEFNSACDGFSVSQDSESGQLSLVSQVERVWRAY